MNSTDTTIMTRNKRVFLIDDHPLMRVGLGRTIEFEDDLETCGELGKGRGAVDIVLSANPDVILLDLSLPDCSGLELIKDLRAAGINAAILVISMHDETVYAERALRAGANGYIMKQEATDCVVEGIRATLSGEVYLSSSMSRRMLNRLSGAPGSTTDGPSLESLTDREFEVFELIGQLMPTREIAGILSISPKTVDAHRGNIRQKLGFKEGSDLVRFAVRWVEAGKKGRDS